MATESNTELLAESRLRGALPSGFKTTLQDSERLRQLGNADLNLTSNVIEDYEDFTLTERDIIVSEVQRTLSSFVTPERTMEFPGTGIEMANDHILQFAAAYKENQDTPSGSIKSPRRANPDDIVFTFAYPEVYEEISGDAQDNYLIEGASVGELEVIGDNGLDDGTSNNSDSSLSLDDNEQLFFTGDFIDLESGRSIVTSLQWVDIDGEDYGRDGNLFSTRLSGNHVMTGQGAWVKQTCDLDMKVYQDGDAEIVPIAFYMGPGGNLPSLT